MVPTFSRQVPKRVEAASVLLQTLIGLKRATGLHVSGYGLAVRLERKRECQECVGLLERLRVATDLYCRALCGLTETAANIKQRERHVLRSHIETAYTALSKVRDDLVEHHSLHHCDFQSSNG